MRHMNKLVEWIIDFQLKNTGNIFFKYLDHQGVHLAYLSYYWKAESNETLHDPFLLGSS